MDELIAAAEKGLDYDRIRPSHDFVKELAAKSGESDVSRYIERVKAKEKPAAEQYDSESAPFSDNRFGELEALLREYPEALKDGKLELPEEVKTLEKSGRPILEAYRVYDLKRTKAQCAELASLLEAERTNRSNDIAAVGSLSGGDAVEKDFYTSGEWDRLPEKTKEKLIRNGKIYQFMKKWSGNE